jgi:hypothetical protein
MKTEAIKRLINAVDVWVACGVFDGTNFNPNTDDAKTELEQLALHNVVGQSEQCTHENEVQRQGDGFIYTVCGDCGEDLD